MSTAPMVSELRAIAGKLEYLANVLESSSCEVHSLELAEPGVEDLRERIEPQTLYNDIYRLRGRLSALVRASYLGNWAQPSEGPTHGDHEYSKSRVLW